MSSLAAQSAALLVVSRSTAGILGGAEVFADTLNRKLVSAGYEVVCARGARGGLLAEYLTRAAHCLSFVRSPREPIHAVLVHYANFPDVVLACLLSLFFRQVFVIPHVGRNWKHLRTKHLLALTRLFLSRSRITVLCLTQEQERVLRIRRAARIPTIIAEEFSLPPERRADNEEKKTVLFFGRISRVKGVLDLIAAHAQLTLPNVRLRLIGPLDPDIAGDLEAAISASPRCEHIQHCRAVYEPTQKREAYLSCDLVALPSYMEALPLTMIEALACNRPVIAGNVGDCASYLEANDALLVTPGNVQDLAAKIDAALSNRISDELLARLAEKSRRIASGALLERLIELGVLPRVVPRQALPENE